ncbi:MAG: alanyl-tRNA editing protein [Inquilinus sp.]|nr:alanyl-tRNA editing protein [Inquilinus sp.]
MQPLFRDDAYLRRCTATVTAVDGNAIALDRTVFYPTGGGQPGDAGRLAWPGGEARIVDARKGDGPDAVLHIAEEGAALPPPGTEVEAEIDWERRHRHMRMHTAMHLLCSLVEGDVTGGQVGVAKSRLDFNVPAAALDKEAITAALNRLVDADLPVTPRWIDDAELAARPELVRTMSVKPPSGHGRVRLLQIGADDAPADLQPCGGTHVARTGEIGRVVVSKIENKGRQNRRVNIVLADA